MAFLYTVRETTQTAKVDEKGVRRYTRNFEVSAVSDSGGPMDNSGVNVSDAVLTYLGIAFFASYNDGFVIDLNALLKSIDVSRQADFMEWSVVLNYDSESNAVDKGSSGAQTGTSPGAGTQNVAPNLRPPTIKFGRVDREKIQTHDRSVDENPIVNSATCPFDPPFTLQVPNMTLTITYFKATADWAKIATYVNAINDNAWLPFGAGSNSPAFETGFCRCTDYQINSSYENGAWWWEYTVVVEISSDDPWNPVKILDAGVLEKPPPSFFDIPGIGATPLKPITHNGQPVSAPVPLDGAGRALATGGNPVYLEFTVYRAEDFDSIF